MNKSIYTDELLSVLINIFTYFIGVLWCTQEYLINMTTTSIMVKGNPTEPGGNQWTSTSCWETFPFTAKEEASDLIGERPCGHWTDSTQTDTAKKGLIMSVSGQCIPKITSSEPWKCANINTVAFQNLLGELQQALSFWEYLDNLVENQ